MTDRSTTPVDPEAALPSLRSAFARARAAHPSEFVESYYTLAGQTVRLRIVGRQLAAHVARPLAHLVGPEAVPEGADLTVELWDEEATQVPWPLGSTPAHLGENGMVTASSDGRLLSYARPHIVLGLDRQAKHVVGWIESSGRLPLVERAKPLSLPFAVWCSDRDVQLVHAGLVARNGHGVLLGGKGGTGKSTAALACAWAGFDFLGDDCVALRLSEKKGFDGHSLYGTTTLHAGGLVRFPPLASQARSEPQPEDEKSLVFLGESPPLHLAREAPIRAVALPRIVGLCESRIRPATKAEALLRLAPSSLVKWAVPPRASLGQLARLLDQVPSYWLELGPDVRAIPQRVERLLAEAVGA